MRERDGPVEYGICTGHCQSTVPHAGPGQTVHSLTTWPSVIPCAKLHLQLTGVTGQIQHTFISLSIKRTSKSDEIKNCLLTPQICMTFFLNIKVDVLINVSKYIYIFVIQRNVSVVNKMPRLPILYKIQVWNDLEILVLGELSL